MYQSPDNFDLENDNKINDDDSYQEFIENSDLSNLARKRIAQRKKHLQKLLVYLIGFGVGLGLLLALIVSIALHKFGLLKKPYQIDSQPQDTKVLELKVIENNKNEVDFNNLYN